MKRLVKVGSINIGGEEKVSVQSMTNVPTADGAKLLAQINSLHDAGADIVRATVNSEEALNGFSFACKNTNIPLVADIHFDYRLAIKACIAGASKIRINPGNIGSEQGIRELVAVLKDKGVPVRIGVNGGSLDKDVLAKYGDTPEGLAESALKHARILEKLGFYDIVLSVKASDVQSTIKANRILNTRCEYPLHIGVTESGGGELALIKSAIGIGTLLEEGIGDTIRVSLSDDPIKEVIAGLNILRAVGLDNDFVNVISCPTCGRTEFDVIGTASALREKTEHIRKKLTIAVMGCTVNGLGEGKKADFGVAGGKDKSILFKKGEMLEIINNENVLTRLLELTEECING